MDGYNNQNFNYNNQQYNNKKKKKKKHIFLKFLLILILIICCVKVYKHFKYQKALNEAENKLMVQSINLDDADEYLNGQSDIEGMTIRDKINAGMKSEDGSDTDSDGLTDKEEIEIYGTDPLKASTSGDLLSDKFKVDNGLDINKKYSTNEYNQELLSDIPSNIKPEVTKIEDGLGIFEEIDYKVPGAENVKAYSIQNFYNKVTVDFSEYTSKFSNYIIFEVINNEEEKDITKKLKDGKIKLDLNGEDIIVGIVETSSTLPTLNSTIDSNSGIEKDSKIRNKTLMVVWTLGTVLGDEPIYLFEESSIFNNKSCDIEYETYLNSLMNPEYEITVKHRYIDTFGYNIYKKFLNNIEDAFSKWGIDNDIMSYFLMYDEGTNPEYMIGLSDDGNIALEKEQEQEQTEVINYGTDFSLEYDTFAFPNIGTYISPEGNCSGIALVTAQLFNGNLYKNKGKAEHRGKSYSYDISDSCFSTLFDRGLSDYKDKDYFIDKYGTSSLAGIDLDTEDKAFVDFLGTKWAEANQAFARNYKYWFGDNDFRDIENIQAEFNKGHIILVDLVKASLGHTINAYKLEQDTSNPNIYYLRCYDNNFPNNKVVVNGELLTVDPTIVITKKKHKSLAGEVTYTYEYKYRPHKSFKNYWWDSKSFKTGGNGVAGVLGAVTQMNALSFTSSELESLSYIEQN